jgi:Rrf2 family protein
MSSLIKMSDAASLALHAMTYMAANSQRPVATKEVATEMHVSESHLAKVLQRLARVGLVHSTRGPKGGFRLARPAHAVTLLDVYEAVDGPLALAGCLFSTPVCGLRQCIFGRLLHSVNRQVHDHFADTRLSDLVREGQDVHVGTSEDRQNR